jgi:Domain of unknown function (DUF4062)/SIR2-like domain
MEDLANERDAVVQMLRALNLEPVNAEGVLPTGGTSWQVISAELARCDLFVLLLGERYGWIPSTGPHAGSGLSVTELEYETAIEQGIPVLAFVKTLKYGTDDRSEDARRRDQFRRRVEDWAEGHFRQEFRLASDLAETVKHSVISLLATEYQRQRIIANRQPHVGEVHPRPDSTEQSATSVRLPGELVRAVADRSAVLFAGAGLSLQAGLPSAFAFAEGLVQRLAELDPDYLMPMGGNTFNAIASDFELLLGRPALEKALQELIGVQDVAAPVQAHDAATRLFNLVITTNYDNLLERSASAERLTLIADEIDGALPERALVKLHGSLDDPSGIVLTDAQLARFPVSRAQLLHAIADQLRSRPVVVIGSSVRDPSIIGLFERCIPDMAGWIVAPVFSRIDRMRVQRWGLTPITASAEEFFAALLRLLADDGRSAG